MDKILEIVDSLIPVITAIIGAFMGGYFTKKNQNDLFDRQIELEMVKEKREVSNEILSIYNKVLKIDGEEMVISHFASGGSQIEFEITTYEEKVRPILYEKYHLLHSNVAKLVRDMDDVIRRCNYLEEVDEHDNAVLIKNYYEMINNIGTHIYESRSDK